MSNTDDSPKALPPLRFRDNLALKLVALSAVVALLIIGHWAYLLVFGTSPSCLNCGVFIFEAFVLFFAIAAVVFGGGTLLLEHVLVRMDLSAERRQYVYGMLGGLFLLVTGLRNAGSRDFPFSNSGFTLGGITLTSRDMAFLTIGMALFLTIQNGLAAFGVIRILGRWKPRN